jgi:hypothetical protein
MPHKVIGNLDVRGTVSGGRSHIRHPRCFVYPSALQIVGNSSQIEVDFDTELEDSLNWHDNSTNNTRVTVTLTGLYFLEGCVEYVNNTTGARGIQFRVNGTTALAPSLQNDTHITTETCRVHASTFTKLDAGDYVEIRTRQISGGDLNTVPSGCYFKVIFLGEDGT